MGLEVYYRQDIRRALLAAEQASSAAMAAVSEGEEEAFAEGRVGFRQGYQEGYRAALTTIALAFGLLLPEGRPEDDHNGEWHLTFLPVGRRGNGKSRPG